MDPISCGTSLVESQGGEKKGELNPPTGSCIHKDLLRDPGLHQHPKMSPAGHSQPCQSWESLNELEQEEGLAKLTGTRYIKLQL